MGRPKKSLKDSVETETVIFELADEVSETSLNDKIEKTRVRPKSYLMDLRIHSPASLGYLAIEGIDTAPALVRLAKVKGLDVIAVTDYYSGKAINKIADAARGTELTVVPGTVIRCSIPGCNDVVLTCLFPESAPGEAVESFLRSLEVPEKAAGNKNYVVQLPFEKVLATLEQHGGMALPSRMDKTPHRMAALPMLVEKYGFRAFDLAYPDSARFFKSRWPKLKFRLFSFSNANALAQVGSRIAKVKMQNPGFMGIRDIIARSTQP
ncbi:MAG: hypothetical protein K1X79_14490 [Oligoflexia bacterium]|nr:hypothetical protein [Oligoflexia bacterium]